MRDRVRASILSAIPDEKVDALIAAEWTAFFEMKQLHYNSERTSPFREMVKLEITKMMQERIRKDLEAAFAGSWNNGQFETAEDLIKLLKPVLYEALMGGIAQTVANNIRMNLGPR